MQPEFVWTALVLPAALALVWWFLRLTADPMIEQESWRRQNR
jgi:hypothetical protein